MLFRSQWLAAQFPESLGFLRVFQYLTFRAVLAAMTSVQRQHLVAMLA